MTSAMTDTKSSTNSKQAFVVYDDDDGAVVVFEKTAVAARRIGARVLDTYFEYIESCRRAPEFDEYAGSGVPNDVLLEHGWWFECYGCQRRISRDLEGEHFYGDRSRDITLKPVFVGDAVYCCPSCKARDEKDRRERKAAEARIIFDFKRRVLKRFPDAEFEAHRPHAYVARSNGVYAVEQVIVRFGFPGMKIGPAEYRYDLRDCTSKIGPHAPQFMCCNGDKDAFEARCSCRSRLDTARNCVSRN
jgi:hypothetical protein